MLDNLIKEAHDAGIAQAMADFGLEKEAAGFWNKLIGRVTGNSARVLKGTEQAAAASAAKAQTAQGAVAAAQSSHAAAEAAKARAAAAKVEAKATAADPTVDSLYSKYGPHSARGNPAAPAAAAPAAAAPAPAQRARAVPPPIPEEAFVVPETFSDTLRHAVRNNPLAALGSVGAVGLGAGAITGRETAPRPYLF